MTREIKFRFWDKIHKDMTLNDSFYEVQRWNRTQNELENFEVMQYTGLKDKNGKEIYEGDIMKVLDRDWSDMEKDTRILIVYFHEGMFELISKEGIEELEKDNPDIYNKKWITARIYKEYGRDRFEIIGNIYENEDLLVNPKGEGK